MTAPSGPPPGEDEDDGVPRPPPPSRAGEEQPAGLAALAGLELPPFDAPLLAFDPAPGGAPGDPVYLGGDLHRVHPDAARRHHGRPRDRSLDEARITVSDHGHDELAVTAVEGVWCLALHGDLLDAAPYFALWDTEGRIRTWLLLPPARLMIGIGHLWLPSVPPPSERPGGAPEPPSAL